MESWKTQGYFAWCKKGSIPNVKKKKKALGQFCQFTDLSREGEGSKRKKLMTSFMDGPLESITKRSEATEAVENAHEAPHHP